MRVVRRTHTRPTPRAERQDQPRDMLGLCAQVDGSARVRQRTREGGKG